MGCAYTNPARVDREDRKDHLARKAPFLSFKIRTPRSANRTPSSPPRLAQPPDDVAERNSATSTEDKGTDPTGTTERGEGGAHNERELHSNIGEHTSRDGLDGEIRGEGSDKDSTDARGESMEVGIENVLKGGDSDHVNAHVSESARIASLREDNLAPTRISSITGEARRTGTLSKKELLLEAIRKATAAAAEGEEEEEEDGWTVEDSLEAETDDLSDLSPSSAARIRSLGLALPQFNERSKLPPSGTKNPSAKARTAARVSSPVFDPTLLVQYEETFNEYTPSEWMDINRSGKPRRRSIEAWMKAEEKTKEAVPHSPGEQARVAEEVVPNVGLKSPTSQFKERTMGGGREIKQGGGHGVRKVKLGDARRQSSRFAAEDDVRRKSVEDLSANLDNKDLFPLRMPESP